MTPTAGGGETGSRQANYRHARDLILLAGRTLIRLGPDRAFDSRGTLLITPLAPA